MEKLKARKNLKFHKRLKNYLTYKKTGSTITTDSIGLGNMRVYVLQNDTANDYGATGKIGKDGAYLK